MHDHTVDCICKVHKFIGTIVLQHFTAAPLARCRTYVVLFPSNPKMFLVDYTPRTYSSC